VVEAENMVVNDAFDEVKGAEPDEHCGGKGAGRPSEVARAAGPPEYEQSGKDEEIRAGMENAVPERDEPEVFNRTDDIPGTEHVMPLEELVENDTTHAMVIGDGALTGRVDHMPGYGSSGLYEQSKMTWPWAAGAACCRSVLVVPLAGGLFYRHDTATARQDLRKGWAATSSNRMSAAIANATGNGEQRLARWLLMHHDRAGNDHLRLSHDGLADALSIRRSSVTEAIHRAEGRGYLRSERMDLQILKRQGLIRLSNGLYGLAESSSEVAVPDIEL
jgi:hypothetical protein